MRDDGRWTVDVVCCSHGWVSGEGRMGGVEGGRWGVRGIAGKRTDDCWG